MTTFLNAHFGVEIEFTGISRRMAAQELAKVLGTSSIEHRGGYDARIVKDAQGRSWKIVSDGSIATKLVTTDPLSRSRSEFQCEFVTPVLSYTEDIETLQNIIRALRKAGGCVTDTCGIHIHLDGADHDVRTLKNFVNLIAGHSDLLYSALQVGRYRVNYCKKLSERFLNDMATKKPKTREELEEIWYNGQSARSRHEHYNNTRYHFLNLHSFFHGVGTVELRGFNSTLHAGIVRAYIVLALAMNHQALTSKSIRAAATAVQSDNPKFAMRTWMNRMGLIGEEYANCRKHLMQYLPGNAAWRFGRVA